LTGAHHLFVTDALGCSLVSFKFTATPAELSDPTRCYWKKEAGWYEAVLAAQDKVCELFKLEKRKLILMAESAGSNLAEGVAVAYPDRVEAAALIGGEDFGMPIPKKSPVTWLVMNSRGDSTGPASRRIAGELLASGASVLYASPAVNHGLRGNLMYHHVPGPQSRHLMSAFVWGVLRSRALGEKASFEQRFPYTVLPGEKSRFLVEATSRLPAGDRMPSPAHLFFSSSALAFSWGQVTPAVQRAQLLAGREKVNVFLGFPALPRPKAVVLLYDALTYLNYAETHEDVASLAELGMVALAPSKMGKTASIPSYCEAAKSWLASQPALQGVPLYCYGKGKSGADFLAYASTSALPNMAGFAYVDLGEGGPARESEDKIKNLADQYDAFLLGMKEDEKGENKDLERLASSMFNHKAEKRGSKKLLFKNKDSDGRIYGQCIIALNNLIDPPPAAAGDKDNDKEKEKDKKEKKK
jgi:pimeloyl-ACP methyl ester carboxylesterase